MEHKIDYSKYDDYELEEFLQDDDFIRWLKEGIFRDQWNEWLSIHPEKDEIVDLAKTIVSTLKISNTRMGKQELKDLWHRIEADSQDKIVSKKIFLYSRRRWIGVAASVAALALVGWFGRQTFMGNTYEYRTAYGEFKNIELEDGTTVNLNANSRLTISKESNRDIYLEGEAFFKVAKAHDGASFKVRTQDLSVNVLGTEFNVKSRGEETEVYLSEGKVELHLVENERNLGMVPGELVFYSAKSKKPPIKTLVDEKETISWKDGTIFFSKTPLPEVLKKLSEMYGVKFELKSERLTDKLLSGGMTVRNLDIALLTLETIYNLDVENSNGRYIIDNDNNK